MKYTEHHMWCNFWLSIDVENCKMCKGLYKNYPYNENESPDDLMAKHFPENIKIK